MADQITVIFGDAHIPGQVDSAIRILLHTIAWCEPTTVVCCGDLVDYDYFSKWPKTFGQRFSVLENDLQMAIALFQAIKAAAPNAKLVFLEGNHEDRLKSWCANQIAGDSLYPSLSIQYRLQSVFPNITYIPFSNFHTAKPSYYAINRRFIVVHGWTHAENAISKHLMLAQGLSIAFGHVHYVGALSKSTSYHPKRLRHALSVGCLCHLQPPWSKKPTGWSQGFGVVFSSATSDTITMTTIENDRGIYDGKLGVRPTGYEPIGKPEFTREEQEHAHQAIQRARRALEIWEAAQVYRRPWDKPQKRSSVLVSSLDICWGPH